MKRSLLLFCVVVAVLGAPAPRRSILGRLGAATAGIAIGSGATSMATGIASQSLGLAGQALGQIPFLGPLAQIGTSIGKAGVEAGNGFAQMGLGIGQAAVNSHAVGATSTGGRVAQNIIQGLAAGARVPAAPVQGGSVQLPALSQPNAARQPNTVSQPNAARQPNAASQPSVPSLVDRFWPQKDYDYYGTYDDYEEPWNGRDYAQQQNNNRNPPPQAVYIGTK